MLRAEVQMLAPVSGTIFGREVVPDVWRMSATSWASAGPGRAAGRPGVAAKPERARPDLRLGHERDQPDAELLRRLERRRFAACFDDKRLGLEIVEVEEEFVLAIGGVQRRRSRRGGHGKKRGRHLRSVRQDDGDAVAAADAKLVQLRHGSVDERAQGRVGQRRRVMARDGGRLVLARRNEASQGVMRAHAGLPPPLLMTVSPRSFVAA